MDNFSASPRPRVSVNQVLMTAPKGKCQDLRNCHGDRPPVLRQGHSESWAFLLLNQVI